MNADQLHQVFLTAWCAETAMGEWSTSNRSLNQCAVTALVVQDLYGGSLLRCEVSDGGSHYWNKLPNGTELDLCSDQFDHLAAHPLKEKIEERSREIVLSAPSTVKRYRKLAQRVSKLLQTAETVTTK